MPCFPPTMLNRPFAGRVSRLGWVLLVSCVIGPPGCRHSDISPQPPLPPVQQELRAHAKVALPPGIAAEAVTPYSDSRLSRANQSLQQILPTLAHPSALPDATDLAATQPTSAAASQPDEPSRPWLDQYAAWRLAYLEGRWAKALETLLSLTEPMSRGDQAHLQRAIAQTCWSQGNPARAAIFYRQALALEPDDLESLFWISRWLFDQNDWNALIVVAARALNLPTTPDRDPVQIIFLRHLLASALQRQGYDRAAIEQWQLALQQAQGLSRTSRFGRELLLIQRQSDQWWIAVGDAYLRLGQLPDALQAYRQAPPLHPFPACLSTRHPLPSASSPSTLQFQSAALAEAWCWRWLYSCLLLERWDDAAALILEQIQQSPEQAASFWRYALANGLPADRLIPLITNLYETRGQPESLALLLAELQPPEQAIVQLETHLSEHPHSWRTYEELIQRRLSANRPQDDRQAVKTTLRQIIQLPQAAENHANWLVRQPLRQPAMRQRWQSAIDSELKTAQGKDQAALLYLMAHARQATTSQWMPTVGQNMTQALELWPDFVAARLMLVRWAVQRQDPALAETTFAPLLDQDSPQVVATRAWMLKAGGHQAAAHSYVQSKWLAHPDRIDLILLRAELLIQSQQFLAAEQLLLQAIARLPEAESLYESLWSLYETDRLPNTAKAGGALLQLAAKNIPSAKITRLQLTRQCLRLGEWDRAEQMLRLILSKDPADTQAIELACLVLIRQGRRPAAQALLEQTVSENPDQPAILTLAQRFYVAIDEPAKAADYALRYAQTFPPGPQQAFLIATAYAQSQPPQMDLALKALEPYRADLLRQATTHLPMLATLLYEPAGRQQELDSLFRDAIAQHPDQAQELTVQWAMSLERQGQSDRSIALLEQVLAQNPRHAHAANGLAYRLAVLNRQLDRAEQLSRMTLETEPNNAAYLDTLGWVLYQKGQYEGAMEMLKRAVDSSGGTHPVIVGHLGDALDRLGQKEQAIHCWRTAFNATTDAMMRQDPEVRELAPIWKQRLSPPSPPSPPSTPSSVAPPMPFSQPANP